MLQCHPGCCFLAGIRPTKNAVVDLSGRYTEQAGGFSDRNTLMVSLVWAGNSLFVTNPSDTGISKAFSFRGGQTALI
ncbi:hypothetical protein [Lacrimispora sp.]|uniref:hypothetical protein n=1 Tax=Lacrimispora sp. TaxID=2719234 RepID=UPI00289EFB43|nr:hypothetical protein [Lacrimispora sp.]